MPGPLLHRHAAGIHPGAYVQDTAPVTTDVQDHVLWVDTSSGPPYQLKLWDVTTATWFSVGSVSGVDGDGNLAVDCLGFPQGAFICNDPTNVVTVYTPDGTHTMDMAGLAIPGGHRLERVSG